MPSRPQHRRLWLNGYETSLKIEAELWSALTQIARRQRRSVECLLCDIQETRPRRGLRSAVIDFVLTHA